MDPDGHRRRVDLTERARAAQLSTRAGVGLFALSVVAQLVRSPGVPLWDTIWVEDGPIYVEQANAEGPFAVVFRGYAGYLQLSNRLLAIPTAWLPGRTIAAYLAVSSAIVASLCAAFLYRSTAGWIATVPIRIAVAAIAVVGPATAIETTATITNSLWPLLAVTPWAFISLGTRARDVVMRCAVAFLAATATVLSVVFVPLAIAMAMRRRAKADFLVAGSLAVGLAVQATVALGGSAPARTATSGRALVDLFAVRVLGSALIGERPLDQLWTGVGEPIAVVFVAVTAAVLVVCWRGAPRRSHLLACVLLGLAVALFLVPVLGRGTEVIGFDVGVYSINMTRFTLAPILMLVCTVAVLVDPCGPSRNRRCAVNGRKVMLVQITMVVLIGFVTETVRSGGPGWVEESARVHAADCTGAPPDRIVHITTTPNNFTIALPCSRIAP